MENTHTHTHREALMRPLNESLERILPTPRWVADSWSAAWTTARRILKQPLFVAPDKHRTIPPELAQACHTGAFQRFAVLRGAPVESMLEHARGHTAAPGLAAVGHGDLLVVRDSGDSADPRRLDQVVSAILAETEIWAVAGIGQALEGPSAAAKSFEQALDSLEALARGVRLPPVLPFERALPYLLLLRDPEYASYALEAMRWMENVPENKKEFVLDLLDAFFDSDRTAAGAARAMQRPERTVGRWLRTINDISNLRPYREPDATLLDLGRRALHLWPLEGGSLPRASGRAANVAEIGVAEIGHRKRAVGRDWLL